MKVWFVLYKKGTNKQISEGAVSLTVDDGTDIDGLRDAIKARTPNFLRNVDPAALAVYSSGTDAAALQFLDPGDPAPNNTSSKYPLVVTAPVRDPASERQADGELKCCFRIVCILVVIALMDYYQWTHFIEFGSQ